MPALPRLHFYTDSHESNVQILDEIASDAKIKNENNKPGARKLILVDLKSGNLIPLSTVLSSLLSDSDIIMLDYEDSYMANKSRPS